MNSEGGILYLLTANSGAVIITTFSFSSHRLHQFLMWDDSINIFFQKKRSLFRLSKSVLANYVLASLVLAQKALVSFRQILSKLYLLSYLRFFPARPARLQFCLDFAKYNVGTAAIQTARALKKNFLIKLWKFFLKFIFSKKATVFLTL